MKYTVFIPILLLVLAILLAYFSGNDKAVFLILFVIGINVLTLFGSIIAFLMRKIPLRSFFILTLPTLYVILIFIGAKQELLDSQVFLGIR